MNELDKNSQTDAVPTPQTEQVDAARRRLTRGGAAGAGVLLSVASRSAFGTGTWGTCTGSEIASGNLSRDGAPRPCGCSPGFWGNKNGKKIWQNPDLIPFIYAQGQYFNSVFGVSFFKPRNNETLREAIDKSGVIYDKSMSGGWCPTNKVNNMKTCAFHAVAALLNAQYYGNRYPVIGMQSPEAVIAAFQTAFSGGVPALESFITKVDVYTSGVWCEGQNG
ncbi:MAG: hypothetical protein RBS46_15475 [Methyloversatilis sp.]|jgi:hypothetical protein|nr:hypothetical protein [Methyloversatilis sp.]